MEEKVGIVGAGKLGGSLARALCEAGVKVVAITDRVIARAISKAEKCGDETCAVPMVALPNDLTMLIIAVSDDAILKVANFVARLDKVNQDCVVAHTSGVLSSFVLSNLKPKTKLIASFYPVQTFSGSEDDWQRLFGIAYGLEGNSEAVIRLHDVVKKLHGNIVEIPVDKKELYHLSCIMASNFLVALQAAATKVMSRIGIDNEEGFSQLEPLIYATLDNIRHMGHSKALTGPIVRRDIGTIERHLKALSTSFPDLVPLYLLLSLLEIDLILDNNHKDKKLSEIENKLKQIGSESIKYFSEWNQQSLNQENDKV